MYAVLDNNPLYSTLCRTFKAKVVREALQIKERYSQVDSLLPFCAYVHLINWAPKAIQSCKREQTACECKLESGHQDWIKKMLDIGEKTQIVD
jgi:hypothetical protein